MQFGDGTRKQVIMVLSQTRHGGFTLDPAQGGEHLGQHHSAVAAGHAIGADPLEQCKCIFACDLVLGKAG